MGNECICGTPHGFCTCEHTKAEDKLEDAATDASVTGNGRFMEHSEVSLSNVHSYWKCQKPEPRPCTIHNRSDHAMRDFPQEWSSGNRKMLRICPDMIGHSDPDEPGYAGCKAYNCDMCCTGDVFH